MDMCLTLATAETLSATQALCLWLGCQFGLTQAQAALGGLMLCVAVVVVVIVVVGSVLERTPNGSVGGHRGRR